MACGSAGRTGRAEAGEKEYQETGAACWWHYKRRFVYGLLCSVGEGGDCCWQGCWDTWDGRKDCGWGSGGSSC